jgi:hypothetical protein
LENKGEIQKIKKFEETVITQNTEHKIEHKTETDSKQQTTATIEEVIPVAVKPTETPRATKEITPTTPTINLDVKLEDVDLSQFNQLDSFESDKKEKINKLMKLGKNN